MIGKYHLALYNVLESYYEFQGDTLKIEKKNRVHLFNVQIDRVFKYL